jgi:hypothetical protein
MKRFVAVLNDCSFINIPASHMEKEDNALLVWNENNLVAYIETGAVISAHIGERKE